MGKKLSGCGFVKGAAVAAAATVFPRLFAVLSRRDGQGRWREPRPGDEERAHFVFSCLVGVRMYPATYRSEPAGEDAERRVALYQMVGELDPVHLEAAYEAVRLLVLHPATPGGCEVAGNLHPSL